MPLPFAIRSPLWCWASPVTGKKASSRPLSSSQLILLVLRFLHSVLGWGIYTLPSCWSGWLRKIISTDYFRADQLHNQLTHSTDTVVYLQQRSLSGPHWDKFSFLHSSCGHSLRSFLSFMTTPSLSTSSEPFSTAGVDWSHSHMDDAYSFN